MSDNQFIKDPQAVEWFGVNWATRLAGEDGLLEADTVSTSTWTVPSGLTAAATLKTDSVTGVKLSGGTLGTKYAVVNQIVTTTNAETLEATIYVYIRNE